MEAKMDMWERDFDQPEEKFLETMRNKEFEERKTELMMWLKYSKNALVKFGYLHFLQK